MTRTSRVVEEKNVAGVTLFELLLVLALLAVMAGFTSILAVNAMPERRAAAAVAAFEDDLRAIRLYVRRTGQAVDLTLDNQGYSSPQLGVSNSWPDALSASWRDAEGAWSTAETRLIFSPVRLAWQQFEVRLISDRSVITVTQSAVTGRIDRRREARRDLPE